MDSTVPVTRTGASRSPAEIERDLEQTRERLAASIDNLAERVHPKTLAKRSADKAKANATDAAARAALSAQDVATRARVVGLELAERALAVGGDYAAKAQIVGRDSAKRARAELVDPSGSPRVDRLLAAGAAAMTLVGLVLRGRRR